MHILYHDSRLVCPLLHNNIRQGLLPLGRHEADNAKGAPAHNGGALDAGQEYLEFTWQDLADRNGPAWRSEMDKFKSCRAEPRSTRSSAIREAPFVVLQLHAALELVFEVANDLEELLKSHESAWLIDLP